MRTVIKLLFVVQLGISIPYANAQADATKPVGVNHKVAEFNKRIEDGEEIARLLGQVDGSSQFLRLRIISAMRENDWTDEERNYFIEHTNVSFERVDGQNAEIVKTILSRWGWRELHRIEPQFVERAWSAVNHSANIEWQKSVLSESYELVKDGIIDPLNYANLYDSVEFETTGLLRYGTKKECTSEGLVYIDGREASEFELARKDLGLPLTDEDKELHVQLYGPCPSD